MKRWAIDILVFGAITVVTTVFVFAMGDRLYRVQRNWGDVCYQPPITRGEALQFAGVLADVGLFAGKPTSVQLTEEHGIYVWRLVYERDYAQFVSREQIVNGAQLVCRLAFPDKPVRVDLADPQFHSFEVLIPANGPDAPNGPDSSNGPDAPNGPDVPNGKAEPNATGSFQTRPMTPSRLFSGQLVPLPAGAPSMESPARDAKPDSEPA